MSDVAQPMWTTGREAVALCFSRRALSKALMIAAVVGTLLSLINQGAVILGGDATPATWARVVANFIVPFCVSSFGYLSATRARPT